MLGFWGGIKMQMLINLFTVGSKSKKNSFHLIITQGA